MGVSEDHAAAVRGGAEEEGARACVWVCLGEIYVFMGLFAWCVGPLLTGRATPRHGANFWALGTL